jgi:hypothetical protein
MEHTMYDPTFFSMLTLAVHHDRLAEAAAGREARQLLRQSRRRGRERDDRRKEPDMLERLMVRPSAQ